MLPRGKGEGGNRLMSPKSMVWCVQTGASTPAKVSCTSIKSCTLQKQQGRDEWQHLHGRLYTQHNKITIVSSDWCTSQFMHGKMNTAAAVHGKI
eukprot:scaffold6897_cov20-Tisochrysis_lutea.AAC.1